MLWLLSSLALAGEGNLIVQTFNKQGLAAPGSVVTIVDSQGQQRILVSDQFGNIFQSLPEGTYSISAEGFQPIEVIIVDGKQSEILFSATMVPELDIPSMEEQQQAVDETTPMTTINGRILDLENNPIPEALIILRGRTEETRSDANGYFELSVPLGIHDLVVMKQDFVERRFNEITVMEDTPSMEIIMSPRGFQLSDFTISAPRILGTSATMLAERKDASSVNDVLGAEQMSRSGDADAAAALKRVTGLTVVGGKYVYVRGLGERYSASLLNGSTLPSPEPERRVVPLDLFPTSMLESITIQKTFSPDRPAEFGGGMVALQTRGIPDEPLFQMGISGRYIENSTFQVGQSGFKGSTDWSSFGTKDRALPEEVSVASDANPLEETDMFASRGYTASELESFGEAMPNHWALEDQTVLPNVGANIVWGRGFDIGALQYGVLVAGLWKNGWDLNQFDRNYFLLGENNSLEKSHTYYFEELTHNIRLSGAIMNSWEWNDHKVNSSTLINRSSSNSTRTYQGYNRDVATDIRVTRINWKERALLFQQFQGDHPIHAEKNWALEWRYAFSKAQRQEPDRREYRYDLEEGTDDWYLSDRPEGNSIFYSNLLDRNHDGTLQLNKRFTIGESARESVFKSGAGAIIRRRGVDTRRYKYMHKGPLSYDSDILQSNPEDIFIPNNIGTDGFQFEEVTRQTDNYSAEQEIWSAFTMIDAKLSDRWSMLTGVRMEASRQDVQTFELFNPNQTPVNANLESTDFLPALTGSVDIGKPEEPDSMKLRWGYGRTVSRPDFRELSPATFNDVTGGRQVYGNPDLERALMDNIDCRWEWYPNAGESMSVGAFYKKFQQPIESIVVVSAQHSVTYQNAESAQNLGVEVDFRKSFSFLGIPFEDLFLAGNASWIHSRVLLSENAGIQTSNERALQGQSPYVYNLQLAYDHPEGYWGLSTLYNVFGPRITEVGALGAPDYYEQPVHRLDTVGYAGIGHLQLGLKVQNILNWPGTTTTGGEVVEEVYNGRRVSLNLRWQN